MKKALLVVSMALILGRAFSQNDADPIRFTDKLYTMTTLVESINTRNIKDVGPVIVKKQGSGFFFSKLDSTLNEGISSTWLISNRHVLLPDEIYSDTISIFLRVLMPNNQVDWQKVSLQNSYVRENLVLHPDTNIDVAALNLTAALQIVQNSRKNIAEIFTLTTKNFVEVGKNVPEVGDNILAVGYPKGYFDAYNKFPIVKAGIISSAYGLRFNNLPCFMIDCKLFPGSSGSLILKQPNTSVRVKNQNLVYNKEKEVTILGVFSGEPKGTTRTFEIDDMTISHVPKYNLGAVWYAEVIKELLKIK